MAGFWGADTEALRDYSGHVVRGGQALGELRDRLQQTVTSVEWIGPDADSFRDDFTGRISSLFRNSSDLLIENSRTLEQHAEEQDDASATGGADGGGSGGGILDAIGDFFRDLGEGINNAIDTIFEVTGIKTLWNGISDAARSVLDSPLVKGVTGFLGKLGPVGQFLGSGLNSIVGGAHTFLDGVDAVVDPPHDGWRGLGDRVFGGLKAVSGAGQIASTVGVPLGPIGPAGVAMAGAASNLWDSAGPLMDTMEAGGSVSLSDAVSTLGPGVSGLVNAAGGPQGISAMASGSPIGGLIAGSGIGGGIGGALGGGGIGGALGGGGIGGALGGMVSGGFASSPLGGVAGPLVSGLAGLF